jgi:hypothetical protein
MKYLEVCTMFGYENRHVIAKSFAGVTMIWTLGLGRASAQTWQPLNYIDSWLNWSMGGC